MTSIRSFTTVPPPLYKPPSGAGMPIVSAFFGIVIRMYYREHEPPHFHAEYSGHEAVFELRGNRTRGDLGSRRAERLIRLWARRRRLLLELNWRRAAAGEPILPIPPLE